MRRLTAVLLAGLLTLMMSACSASPQASASEDTQTEAPTPTQDPVAGLSFATGQVTAIEDLIYTLALGELVDALGEPAGRGGGGADGAPPEPPRDALAAAPEGADMPAPADQSPASGSGERAPDGRGTGAPPELPAGAVPGGSRFVSGGRNMEVDMRGAVMRGLDGELEPDVPVSDIVVGDVITVFLSDSDACAYVTVLAAAADIMGGRDEAEQGTAASTIDAAQEVTGETFASSGEDENALRVSGAAVTLSDVTVSKSGSCTNTESGDFYGMNAALLATGEADLIMNGCRVQSDAVCGNGVFSYGRGTSVSVSESEITTTGDHSGGLQTAGGASMDAQNVAVVTSGSSSAAIRSDRGGGTVTVNGGSYTTSGLNSPAVYSTAEISVANAELRATGSEAVVVEGRNSLMLSACSVSGAMSRTEGSSSSENVHNIMIYQSMSGDAETGEGSFEMQGGSLVSQNGDMFFVTNTTASIELNGVEVTNRDQLAWLFNVSGNSGSLGWGTAGSNGAHADITLRNQTTVGDTRVDSVSSVTLRLAEGTYLRGGIRLEQNEAAAEGAVGTADVVIEPDCTWSLTGDSQVTTLDNQGTIEFNGHTVTLADGTVLSS